MGDGQGDGRVGAGADLVAASCDIALPCRRQRMRAAAGPMLEG